MGIGFLAHFVGFLTTISPRLVNEMISNHEWLENHFDLVE